MIGFVIYQPTFFFLLLLVPALIFLFYRAMYKRRKALKILFPHRKELFFHQLNSTRKWKMLLVCFAVSFIIIALARPAWDLKTTESIREGRDIVVLLDVSRSMLAEDVFPNRLESAKEAIIEFSEELNGDRISLVVFAGASQIICPLSFDYAFFKNVVSEVDWQSASVGGTFVSEGLKKVAEDLLSVQKQADVDILIISDGGDMGNLDSLENYIIDNDIKLITIGVGNPNMGSLIPEFSGNDRQTKSYIKHNGKPVTTTLEAAPLKQIARLTAGNYVEAGINAMNLIEIYKKHKHINTQKKSKGSEITSFKEQFQWFLIFAITLLFVTLAIPRKIRNKTFSLLLFGLLIIAASCSSHKQKETNKTTRGVTQHIKEGIEHYQKKEYSSARNAFTLAYENSTVKESRALMAYNIANCYYKEAFNIVIDVEEEEEFDINAFMLSQFIESERFYRIAINIDSSLQNAYFNFEVVRKAKLKLIEEMNRDEALSEEVDDPIREILALLNMEKGIQAQLNKEVNALKSNPFQQKRKKKQPLKK